MQSWEAARVRREAAERDKSDAFKARIRMDLDTVHECLSETLMALEWPRETMLSYQIDVPRRRLWIDGDLPEIEYLPERSGSLCADGRRIIWRALFERAKREAYARHMHGIVLRVASVTFAALPSMRACFVRGFSQRTDPATGLVRDDYLLVVGFDRAGFGCIDFTRLDLVDPLRAAEAFELRRRTTATGIFTAIVPFEPGAQ
jgi:hypothetical protein